MSGKRCEGKCDDDDDDDIYESKHSESKNSHDKLSDYPRVDVTQVEIDPVRSEICDPFDLKITFVLDRDVVAAFWRIKFLVDSADKRLFKVLGETPVEDYPDGDSEMFFSAEPIDISGIPRSTLANAGLLMACFVVDGEEVASVNMVVNVRADGGTFSKEILNPLE
eukprot:gene7614-15598_t